LRLTLAAGQSLCQEAVRLNAIRVYLPLSFVRPPGWPVYAC